jgi:hypothetical protein
MRNVWQKDGAMGWGEPKLLSMCPGEVCDPDDRESFIIGIKMPYFGADSNAGHREHFIVCLKGDAYEPDHQARLVGVFGNSPITIAAGSPDWGRGKYLGDEDPASEEEMESLYRSCRALAAPPYYNKKPLSGRKDNTKLHLTIGTFVDYRLLRTVEDASVNVLQVALDNDMQVMLKPIVYCNKHGPIHPNGVVHNAELLLVTHWKESGLDDDQLTRNALFQPNHAGELDDGVYNAPAEAHIMQLGKVLPINQNKYGGPDYGHPCQQDPSLYMDMSRQHTRPGEAAYAFTAGCGSPALGFIMANNSPVVCDEHNSAYIVLMKRMFLEFKRYVESYTISESDVKLYRTRADVEHTWAGHTFERYLARNRQIDLTDLSESDDDGEDDGGKREKPVRGKKSRRSKQEVEDVSVPSTVSSEGGYFDEDISQQSNPFSQEGDEQTRMDIDLGNLLVDSLPRSRERTDEYKSEAPPAKRAKLAGGDAGAATSLPVGLGVAAALAIGTPEAASSSTAPSSSGNLDVPPPSGDLASGVPVEQSSTGEAGVNPAVKAASEVTIQPSSAKGAASSGISALPNQPSKPPTASGSLKRKPSTQASTFFKSGLEKNKKSDKSKKASVTKPGKKQKSVEDQAEDKTDENSPASPASPIRSSTRRTAHK